MVSEERSLNGSRFMYLHGRQQSVKIGEVLSGWISVCCGVPQGSFLLHCCFTLYIN